jgi:hypothetical protein
LSRRTQDSVSGERLPQHRLGLFRHAEILLPQLPHQIHRLFIGGSLGSRMTVRGQATTNGLHMFVCRIPLRLVQDAQFW